MAKCGWCKRPSVEYAPDGMLEPHSLPDTRKRCRGYDNPSIQLVKQTNESTKKYDPDWEQRSAQRMLTVVTERITQQLKDKAISYARRKEWDKNNG